MQQVFNGGVYVFVQVLLLFVAQCYDKKDVSEEKKHNNIKKSIVFKLKKCSTLNLPFIKHAMEWSKHASRSKDG